ncbi:hypothetical protein GCM10011390_48860 [Aureimonas endophytica]|uniref:DUF2628 domain-containing protein n=1 Tax=Aureimonas endophytica TaxID=2027858 RepID=A0A917A2M9_9HYPH|nr:DUF2628 domain-containing protein [Aureimonas endophytica]GGE23662.1 hypothetical protein GCM10011390_48860 [Aureimonas endophytica]
MTRYIVFEPPPGQGEAPGTPSENAVFVRDAFSVWAFLFPWIWLLRYGLFVSGLVVFLASGGLGWLARQGATPLAAALLALLGLLVALEGPRLRGWRLRRKRYVETGAFEAANAEEAAVYYYHAVAGRAGRKPHGAEPGEAAYPWGFADRAPRAAPRRRGGWFSRTGSRDHG